MNREKIANWLDGFYNDHLVNGATLFGIFLALYWFTQLQQFAGNKSLILGMMIFFALSLYEIFVKGIIVILLWKKIIQKI